MLGAVALGTLVAATAARAEIVTAYPVTPRTVNPHAVAATPPQPESLAPTPAPTAAPPIGSGSEPSAGRAEPRGEIVAAIAPQEGPGPRFNDGYEGPAPGPPTLLGLPPALTTITGLAGVEELARQLAAALMPVFCGEKKPDGNGVSFCPK